MVNIINKKYISFKDFGFKWRFTEEKYNKLSQEELERIKPLSKSFSKDCWRYWFSDKVGHLMKLDVDSKTNATTRNNCGWGEVEKEKETVKFLDESIGACEGNKIIFFWSSSYSLETTWSIFLKYWTDFCYPSDDSNIIIIYGCEKAVIYVEDKMIIVDRKEYFAQN